MALEDIASTSRATLERGLGQQRGSESECAYVPLSVWLRDSKHVQKTMDTPGATLRAGCETRELCIHPQSGHSSPTKKGTWSLSVFPALPIISRGTRHPSSLQASASAPPCKLLFPVSARCANSRFLRSHPPLLDPQPRA